MKINYIILTEKKQDISTETKDSVKSILTDDDKINTLEYNEWEEVQALNEYIKTLIGFTHVCIVPNGSVISEVTNTVIKKYIKDEETVYLPLVSYLVPVPGTEPVDYDLKGVLNSCIWKPYLAHKTGILNQELSLKQIDTTLYGAFLPLSILQKYPFKEDIKYFSFFEFLNRITYKKVNVVGIPKLAFHLKKDYELKGVDNKEKVVYFKKAQESYKD
jgi:hypothetical protein